MTQRQSTRPTSEQYARFDRNRSPPGCRRKIPPGRRNVETQTPARRCRAEAIELLVACVVASFVATKKALRHSVYRRSKEARMRQRRSSIRRADFFLYRLCLTIPSTHRRASRRLQRDAAHWESSTGSASARDRWPLTVRRASPPRGRSAEDLRSSDETHEIGETRAPPGPGDERVDLRRFRAIASHRLGMVVVEYQMSGAVDRHGAAQPICPGFPHRERSRVKDQRAGVRGILMHEARWHRPQTSRSSAGPVITHVRPSPTETDPGEGCDTRVNQLCRCSGQRRHVLV